MKAKQRKSGALAAVLVAVMLSAGAQAAQVKIDIVAQVTVVDDPNGLLGNKVQVGDLVTGTYSYESTTPDSNPAIKIGDYWHSSPRYGVALNVNELQFRTDPNDVDFLIEIVNDYNGRDNYLFRSYNNLFDASAPSDGPLPADNHIAWQLDDPSMLALQSARLPTTPPDLPSWQSLFGLTITSEGGMGEHFFIRAKVVSAIPAPQ